MRHAHMTAVIARGRQVSPEWNVSLRLARPLDAIALSETRACSVQFNSVPSRPVQSSRVYGRPVTRTAELGLAIS